MLVRYRCRNCGTRLETPLSLVGDGDPCPNCGFTNTVPAPKRGHYKYLVAALASLGVGLTIVITAFMIWPSTLNTRPPHSELEHHEETPTAPSYTILKETTEDGYYAWLAIEPSTEKELHLLGQHLINRAQKAKMAHLKAWVYYGEADYRAIPDGYNICPISLYATGPEWKLRISGEPPEEPTATGCFQAMVRSDPLWEPAGQNGALFQTKYIPSKDAIVIEDRMTSGYISWEVAVWKLAHHYLPGATRFQPWACVPNLKSVTVKLYGEDADTPSLVVRIGRQAWVTSLRMSKQQEGAISRVYDLKDEIQKRYEAQAITAREYEYGMQKLARVEYNLAEQIWIEAAQFCRIMPHDPLPRGNWARLHEHIYGSY